ncbi:MAG: hypothetical protein RSA01_01150 [Clostridium sp.]
MNREEKKYILVNTTKITCFFITLIITYDVIKMGYASSINFYENNISEISLRISACVIMGVMISFRNVKKKLKSVKINNLP